MVVRSLGSLTAEGFLQGDRPPLTRGNVCLAQKLSSRPLTSEPASNTRSIRPRETAGLDALLRHQSDPGPLLGSVATPLPLSYLPATTATLVHTTPSPSPRQRQRSAHQAHHRSTYPTYLKEARLPGSMTLYALAIADPYSGGYPVSQYHQHGLRLLQCVGSWHL